MWDNESVDKLIIEYNFLKCKRHVFCLYSIICYQENVGLYSFFLSLNFLKKKKKRAVFVQ